MTPPDSNTRTQILSIAKRLFIQQGYHGLAMRQISEALGVTKAALYYHFKDKEELFMAILESYLDEMEITMDGLLAAGGSRRVQVQQFVRSVLYQPAEERAIIRLGSQEISQVSPEARQAFNRVYQEKFIGKIEAILRAGIEAGEFRPMQPEVATHALLGIMYPYLYPSKDKDKGVPPETVEQIIRIFLEGVCR
ncbi:MAG TPA: TetR/AcrR family transcriptional regulator [Anaerolineales bacterium]|nr:TetR/AcrR family transcriptional regulator [Anaerolineales bacterium]